MGHDSRSRMQGPECKLLCQIDVADEDKGRVSRILAVDAAAESGMFLDNLCKSCGNDDSKLLTVVACVTPICVYSTDGIVEV